MSRFCKLRPSGFVMKTYCPLNPCTDPGCDYSHFLDPITVEPIVGPENGVTDYTWEALMEEVKYLLPFWPNFTPLP